jgi:hypothetical protein
LTALQRHLHHEHLQEHGYFIIRKDELTLKAPDLYPTSEDMSLHEHTNRLTSIFQEFKNEENEWEGAAGDGLRHQFNPSKHPQLNQIAQFVEDVGVSFFPDLVKSTRHAVVSLPGCGVQAPHMDACVPLPALNSVVDIFKGIDQIVAWETNRPVSVLYCVDDHADVHVWPGTHKTSFEIVRRWWDRRLDATDSGSFKRYVDSENKLNNVVTFKTTVGSTLLHLQKGDMIFFYQDLVHAGAGYVCLNCRLHQFFDNKHVPRVEGRTQHLRGLFDHHIHPLRFSYS